jgi:hypothetical protein
MKTDAGIDETPSGRPMLVVKFEISVCGCIFTATDTYKS